MVEIVPFNRQFVRNDRKIYVYNVLKNNVDIIIQSTYSTIGGCDVTMEERIDGLISKYTFNNLALTVLQVQVIL
jgi:hypothetical protein